MNQATTSFQLAAAEAFVFAHGSPRQRAYWKAAFGWGPVEVWLFEVEHHQGPRGGWGAGMDPRDGGRPDTVPGTATALRWLAWLNLGEDIFEVMPRTLAFLAAYQAADGSWGDEPNDHERAATTATIGAYLAFLGELPIETERAARFVLAHPEAPLPLPVRALTLSLLRGRAPEVVARRELELHAAVEANGLTTVELAWIHEGAVQAGLTPADPLRAAIAPRLLQRQQPDGHFPADDPRWDAVDTTFFAARALVTR
ncbi:MAG: hypothetical protein JWM80_5636 [Cyanobacteria bacterium RYN_339]|nr:hypothetical protein [Cyanobacteria bacterium RYN_339]